MTSTDRNEFADVPAAFDAGASVYDRLVDANPGYHAHLRISAQRMRLPGRGRGLRLLDAGCGTGASTAALLSVAPDAEIIAVEGSAGMLAEARAKRWPPGVRFVHSRIEDLAQTGVSGPFDGIFAAYLLRNLPDPDAELQEFRALLRPGAPLAIHEYSVRDSRLAKVVWNAVCATIIIPSGRIRSGDASLYRYLRDSVNRFDGAAALRNRLQRTGFTAVTSATMTGWQRNIVHTFRAEAPR
jgi:ubiquinone/menaquinone biosynthesis C-methylase UbiE